LSTSTMSTVELWRQVRVHALITVSLCAPVGALFAYAYRGSGVWVLVFFAIPVAATRYAFGMHAPKEHLIGALERANADLEGANSQLRRINMSFAEALVKAIDGRDAGHGVRGDDVIGAHGREQRHRQEQLLVRGGRTLHPSQVSIPERSVLTDGDRHLSLTDESIDASLPRRLVDARRRRGWRRHRYRPNDRGDEQSGGEASDPHQARWYGVGRGSPGE